MKISRDSFSIELASLIGAPPRNQDKWRLMAQDHFELLFPQFHRNEPQNPHSPGPLAQKRLGLAYEPIRLLCPHEGQGQERKAAALSHIESEFGCIANPGHRSLYYRIAG